MSPLLVDDDVADERHRQPALRGERRIVERVEDVAQRAHVAREAPLQVTRGLGRQLETAQVRAQVQRLDLFIVVQLAHREHHRRRQPRLQVRETEIDVRGIFARGEQQRRAALLRALPQREQALLPVRRGPRSSARRRKQATSSVSAPSSAPGPNGSSDLER